MITEKFIPLHHLTTHYAVDLSFFDQLHELGLLNLIVEEEITCIDADQLQEVEKIIRLYLDLDLNVEGIDVVCRLLKKMADLQQELQKTRSRLRLYES